MHDLDTQVPHCLTHPQMMTGQKPVMKGEAVCRLHAPLAERVKVHMHVHVDVHSGTALSGICKLVEANIMGGAYIRERM